MEGWLCASQAWGQGAVWHPDPDAGFLTSLLHEGWPLLPWRPRGAPETRALRARGSGTGHKIREAPTAAQAAGFVWRKGGQPQK